MKYSKNKRMFIILSIFIILYFGSAYYKREQLLSKYQLGIKKIEDQSYQEALDIFLN